MLFFLIMVLGACSNEIDFLWCSTPSPWKMTERHLFQNYYSYGVLIYPRFGLSVHPPPSRSKQTPLPLAHHRCGSAHYRHATGHVSPRVP